MSTFVGKLSLLIALTIGVVAVGTNSLMAPSSGGDCYRICMKDPGSGCDGNWACCQRLCAEG